MVEGRVHFCAEIYLINEDEERAYLARIDDIQSHFKKTVYRHGVVKSITATQIRQDREQMYGSKKAD